MTRPLPKVSEPALRKKSPSLVSVAPDATGTICASTGAAIGATSAGAVADGRRNRLPYQRMPTRPAPRKSSATSACSQMVTTRHTAAIAHCT